MKKAAPHPNDKAEEEIEERISPPGEIVYGAIYREGEHEINRGPLALGFSGLAAGLSMGFSFLAEGAIRDLLPEGRWTPAVAKFGYAIGFLIVILGRQQLFTKNTLTVILPLFEKREAGQFFKVARLWAVVLATNLFGAFLFAAFISRPGVVNAGTAAAFSRIGAELPGHAFLPDFLRAILAGWLIALMIWLLPFAETARVWVITFLAYLIGIAHCPHIIAGAVPAFYLVLIGRIPLAHCLGGILLPTLLGNIVGGVALVAAGAHAEFVPEGKGQAR